MTLFKSDSHFSQDGARDLLATPNRTVWEQIIDDCKPTWVITTGTAGGIGAQREVGDVVVSRFVTFDPGGADPSLAAVRLCRRRAPRPVRHGLAAVRRQQQFLPSTNTRAPEIIRPGPRTPAC